MFNRVAGALMAGTIVVAGVGTGVAIGSSTQPGVHACANKTDNRLGLIKKGKCPHGFKKVTLGATGPRGKTGPQGPGAIEQEMNVPGDDIQHTFSKNVAGIAVHVTCSAAGNPTIDLEAVNSGEKLDFYGTNSSNGAIEVAYEKQISANASVSGTVNAGYDIVARAGTAPFAEFKISSIQSGTTCISWEVAFPTKAG